MAGKTFAEKTKRPLDNPRPVVHMDRSRSLRGRKAGFAKLGPAPTLSGVQAKVKIGKAGDRYEREADAVAESIVAQQSVPAIHSVGGGKVNRKKEEDEAQRLPEQEPQEAQRAPEPDEEQAQRAPERDEEQAQRASEADEQQAQRKHEDETAQAKDSPAAKGGSAAMRAAASHAISYRGAGQALPVTVRGRLESALHRDLKDVRVHTGAEAEQANSVLRSRAFTHDKHIWLGHGQSPHDLSLMAHEVAHVVQQTGKVQRATSDPTAEEKYENARLGTIVRKNGAFEITLANLDIPGFKASFNPTATIQPANTVVPNPEAKWRPGLQIDRIKAMLAHKYESNRKNLLVIDRKKIYIFKSKKGDIYKGTLDEIVEFCIIPDWDRSGDSASYTVDHMQYILLGGSDTGNNTWLLDKTLKAASDASLATAIDQAINKLLSAATGKLSVVPTLQQARSKPIAVLTLKPMPPNRVAAKNNYSRDDIDKTCQQLNGLYLLKNEELELYSAESFSDPDFGTVLRDKDKYTIEVFNLKIPGYKADRLTGPIKIARSAARNTKQASNWDKTVGSLVNSFEAKLRNHYLAANSVTKVEGGKTLYFFRFKKSGEVIKAELPLIASRCIRPNWSREGAGTLFQVDHIHEHQLGGPDEFSNYWLLEQATNRIAGETIKTNKREAVTKLLGRAKSSMPFVPPYKKARYQDIFVKNWVKSDPASIPEGNYYTRSEIMETLKQVDGLRPLSPEEITAHDPAKSAQTLIINYQRQSQAQVHKTPIPATPSGPVTLKPPFKMGNVVFNSLTYDPTKTSGKCGTISGKVNWPKATKPLTDAQEKQLEFSVSLFKIRNQDASVMIDEGRLNDRIAPILRRASKWSPIVIKTAELVPNKGLYVAGVIQVTLPILKGTTIDFTIDGQTVELSKTFTAGEFQLPGPVKATDGSLTAFIGTAGIGAKGTLNYQIEKFGKGKLVGKSTVSDGLDIEGSFTPDTDAVKAEGKIYYRNAKLGGSLDVSVPEGKIPGIRSATMKVTVEDGVIAGTGEIVPKLKAINKGTLSARYQSGQGLEIGAKIDMSGAHPAITSGSLEGQVKQTESGWGFKAAGELGFSVATLSGTVKAEFEDGGFTAVADIDYKKKLVDGKISAGVTNRAIDPQSGVPGGPGTDKFTIFGGGTVGIQFAPWLKGTVGLKLLPSGQVEVSGEVALPSSFEVFPEKKIQKNLFTIGLDIPIVGVAVAGQRIGIFATINGGLDAEAGFGPGQLVDTKVGVTYNPEDEDATKITGSAKFQVPAFAGLRLFVNGGLGAGIPVVSATAGLEVGGKLGLKGMAEAAATIEWTPSAGIELKAVGSVMIQPSFLFDISAFCKVEADLWLTTVELYNERWNLASVEYGSGLDFGLTFPIHYKQGEDFNLSFDQVKLTYPNLDASSLLKGLAKKIF